MKDVLLQAPVPLVLVNQQDTIVTLNHAASALGLSAGRMMADYFDGLKGSFLEAARLLPDSHVFLLKAQAREKRLTVAAIETDEGWYLWLHDLTEQMALGEQLKQLKTPGNRQLRQIHHEVVSGLGYSELVDVILVDQDEITADRMETLQQYHQEVTRALSRVVKIITQDAGGGQRNISRSLVLVADRHEALTELITELLRSEGYRVAGFSDGASAVTYCALNPEGIGYALVDEQMTDAEGRLLLDSLRDLAPGLRILRLTEDGEAQDCIRKPVDFRQLLDALTEFP